MDLGNIELQIGSEPEDMFTTQRSEGEMLRKRVHAVVSSLDGGELSLFRKQRLQLSPTPQGQTSEQPDESIRDFEPQTVKQKPHFSSPIRSQVSRPSKPGPSLVTWFPYSNEGVWLSWKVEVNVPWLVLLIVAFFSRFWRIDFPTSVV